MSGKVRAALAILLGLLCGCADDAVQQPGQETASGLTFVRADSSVFEMPAEAQTFIWCGEWEPGEVPVAALHAVVGVAAPGEPYWWLRAVLRDVELERPLSFPNTFVWDQPDSVHLFLFDPPNELASDTEESSGTITFHRLPCPSGGSVEFTIDAVLGSEFGGGSAVAVRGRFSGVVTAPPNGWGVIAGSIQ